MKYFIFFNNFNMLNILYFRDNLKELFKKHIITSSKHYIFKIKYDILLNLYIFFLTINVAINF